MSRDIHVRPLTAEHFAEFGTLIEYDPGRRLSLVEALACYDPAARPHLDFLTAPLHNLPVTASVLERHPASSQSFVPLDVASYLVCVAPDGVDGRPDLTELDAFIARGDQSVTYAAGVWHLPFTALERAGYFAVPNFPGWIGARYRTVLAARADPAC